MASRRKAWGTTRTAPGPASIATLRLPACSGATPCSSRTKSTLPIRRLSTYPRWLPAALSPAPVADHAKVVLGEWWRRIGHLPQAIMFGSLATILSILMYAVLQRWWIIYPNHNSADVLGVQLAFAAAYAEFVAVFLAGSLGFFAVREFAEHQERPTLALTFYVSPGVQLAKPFLAITTSPGEVAEVSIQITNSGPVTAVWYMLELRVPFLKKWIQAEANCAPQPNYGNAVGIVMQKSMNPVVGTFAEHWRPFWDESKGEPGVTFLSQGSIAAYPKWPLVLSEFNIPFDHIEFGEFLCAYKIAADRSPIECGSLKLVLSKDSHNTTASSPLQRSVAPDAETSFVC